MYITDLLSDESLKMLDWAPGMSRKKEDISKVLSYIESLKSLEKKAFLKCLKDSCESLFNKYQKIEDAKKEKLYEERSKWQKKFIKDRDKKENAFRAFWTEKKILDTVKKVNPEFCGIIFEKHNLYFKYTDFAEAVNNALGILGNNYNIEIVLPVFFDELKSFKKNENRVFNLENPSLGSMQLVLCYSKESREEFMFNAIKYHNRDRSEYRERGFCCMEKHSVDELLNTYRNLHVAIGILINGCIGSDKGAEALIKWDHFRKKEEEKQHGTT